MNSMKNKISLPTVLFQTAPWIVFLFFAVTAWVAPDFFETVITHKDAIEHTGFAENLTVLFLIPAIIFGIVTLATHRTLFKSHKHVAFWILMWTLACIYFAGEEISWGQWLVGWETPDAIAQINDQQESNLHNMSSWLDQKPRLIVETWIFLSGVVWTIIRKVRKKTSTHKLSKWISLATIPSVCFSAAVTFTLFFLADQTSIDYLKRLGNTEIRECFVALFFLIYLGSFLFCHNLPELNAQNPAASADQ
jgi:hypothetical protein